ncbi:MAG: response regulator [Candidatus Kapabacteria bacterium]|nr:response regulator [Ignavibacteriota bacterium]MCW5884672.1 response regulator [Candidatus Kapabacteria bacterium]
MKKRSKILLVDDEPDVLLAYQRNLFKLYNVSIAGSGDEAIRIIEDEGPFSVILSDFNMPGMNGINLLTQVKEISPDSSRLIITGYADVNVAIKSVNDGKVFRFLTKPISMDNLIEVINSADEQYRLVTAEKELLDKTLKGSIKILIDLISITKPEIFALSNQFRITAKRLSKFLKGINPWEVEIAALLSEIGAILIPGADKIENDSYTVSKSDSHNNDELNRIPQLSADILKNIPRLEEIANAIKYQNYEYTYKKGLNQEFYKNDIPIISRIIKIVKDYTLNSKKSGNSDYAYNQLLINKSAYDPEILSKMVDVIVAESKIKKTTVNICNLVPGMVTAENIESDTGLVLISKDRELSEVTIEKLNMLSKRLTIVEPIFIVSE